MIQGNREHSLLSSFAEAAFWQAADKVIQRAKQTGTPIVVWKEGQVEEIPSERLLPNIELNVLADDHRAWLSRFQAQYLRNWEKLLKADQEAALTEACVRRLLQVRGVTIEPNEDLSGSMQAPNFRCVAGGGRFYVEVTCISKAKASEETGLSEEPSGPSNYGLLNDAIFRACKGKAEQCAALDAPVLVAIGTFHSRAATLCFNKVKANMLLTGEAMLTWEVDVFTGSSVGDSYETTELRSAAFLRPDRTEEIGFARSSISGLLLCGCGLTPHSVIGVLHPNPARPFDPALLPNVEFGKVEIDRGSKQLCVRWTGGTRE